MHNINFIAKLMIGCSVISYFIIISNSDLRVDSINHSKLANMAKGAELTSTNRALSELEEFKNSIIKMSPDNTDFNGLTRLNFQ